VHDAIEVLLQRPEAHQLRLLEALTLLSTGTVTMPDDLTTEILRVGASARPEDQLGLPTAGHLQLQAAALERAGWWRSFASFGATPAQSRVAYVVHRAYFLLWQDLKGDVPSGPLGELAKGTGRRPEFGDQASGIGVRRASDLPPGSAANGSASGRAAGDRWDGPTRR